MDMFLQFYIGGWCSMCELDGNGSLVVVLSARDASQNGAGDSSLRSE
jgi:hypothetical protein